MRRPRWLLTAGAGRAGAEAGLLVFALVLPFVAVFAGGVNGAALWPVVAQAAMEAGLLGGLVAAARLRRGADAEDKRLAHGVRAAVALAACLWLGVVLSIGAGSLLATLAATTRGAGADTVLANLRRPGEDAWQVAIATAIMGAFAIITGLVAFGVGRGLVAAWDRWDRMRRTRLRWALTNSLLIVSVSVAIIIGGALSVATVFNGILPDQMGGLVPAWAPTIERVLAAITFQLIPAVIVVFVAPLLISIIIVPPVALISFPVLGRATKRLEELATATSAVRSGDLSARTPVTGEDEIARLQADFNAMAADLERSLAELRAERDAVGRLLEARRELVASVSHELRTPLATLRGYLDSALDHGNATITPELRQDLEIMSGEAERLHRLIDDLFVLSRAEVGRLPLTVARTALPPLLRGVVETMAPLAWNRGRVELSTDVAGELPPVQADPERLEQIVRNLVTNAVRHTPPGGLVLISAHTAGDEVEIQVRDTGEGIDPAELPLIWDRFYRASNARDRAGAGLGLALVKELTEAMGGSVAVESTPGEGSCFSARLPRAVVPGPRPLANAPTG